MRVNRQGRMLVMDVCNENFEITRERRKPHRILNLELIVKNKYKLFLARKYSKLM